VNYTAIDGDMADFVEAQLELATSFLISDLRGYLLKEGHPAGEVEAAIYRWRDRWFVAAAEGFELTPNGRQAIEVLSIPRGNRADVD